MSRNKLESDISTTVPECCFWSNSESRYLLQGEPLNTITPTTKNQKSGMFSARGWSSFALRNLNNNKNNNRPFLSRNYCILAPRCSWWCETLPLAIFSTHRCWCNLEYIQTTDGIHPFFHPTLWASLQVQMSGRKKEAIVEARLDVNIEKQETMRKATSTRRRL